MSFRVITKFETRESEDRLMFIRVKNIGKPGQNFKFISYRDELDFNYTMLVQKYYIRLSLVCLTLPSRSRTLQNL